MKMRFRPQLNRNAGRGEFPALEELPSNQWLELVIFGDCGGQGKPPPLIFLDAAFMKCWELGQQWRVSARS